MPVVTYSLETLESQIQANSWETDDQLAPDVLGLSNGGYVVAYNNVDASNGYILLDFYDAAGHSSGFSIPYTVDGTNTFDSTDAVGAPSLAQLSNGNVVVVWADSNATSAGIRATIFSETGTVVVAEFAVTGFSTDRVPQVTALENGGFVVTYQISGGTVLARIFDDQGNGAGEFVMNTTGGVETEPAIVGLADGGFVGVWTYDNGSVLEVHARIFDADGTPRSVNGSTDDFIVGQFGNNSQPAVAALPNGNWAVVYTDSGWADEDVGITLTIMGPDGSVVNSFTKVNDATDPENEFDPDITVLDNGFILVSWTYPFDPGVDDDIYFRIFDQQGVPVTIDGFSGVRVLDASFDDDVASAVSAMLAGQFIAGWQDTLSDGSGGQITATVSELVRTTTGDGTAEVLNGDALRDIMFGGGGNDTLTGGAGNDSLTGGAGDDTLNGGAGNDSLNGGSGADAMLGGRGNDTYVVSDAGDTAVESSGVGGTDLVRSSVSFTLGARVENLTLTGGAAINGTGNGLANILTGNGAANILTGLGGNDQIMGGGGNDTLDGGAGNDSLNGGGGADAMLGGLGNDTYVVNNAGDTAVESSDVGGTDLVNSSVSFTLGANVENLTLTGGSPINGTGNGIANILTGNGAANTLSGLGGTDQIKGGGGNDTLNGGGGNDSLVGGNGDDLLIGGLGNDTLNGGAGTERFRFDTALNASTNVDNIQQFSVADDTIQLDDDIFTALSTGTLSASAFHTGAAANDSSDRIIYDSATGNIYYDADGTGPAAQVLFAHVSSGLALTNADFVVIG